MHTSSTFSRITLTLVLVVFFCAENVSAQCKQEGSSVVCRDARFQFLSPTSIRMEFAPGSDFTDAPTVVVQKREFKPVQIEVWADKQWLVVKTSRLFLRYKVNSGRFTRENLTITFKGEKKPFWTMADSDRTNLGGIQYSLDGLRKDRMPKAVESGLLSRGGFTVFDDSRSPIIDPGTGWVLPRRQVSNQDLYFFYYGSDYSQMLKWYAELCGPIPMIPRYTLGAWITDLNYEYLPGTKMIDNFKYTDQDVKKNVERFRSEGIPLDVLVLDFAWHNYGWKGGYDWSPIFPKPNEFLDWAHKSGLKVALNDHPGYGKESVLADEDSHSLAIRSELHMAMPEKPTFTLDLGATWKFQTDPSDKGMKEKWFSAGMKDDGWENIQVGKPWEDQGHPGYDGIAWYRQTVSPPVNMPFGNLYLTFNGVDDEYDLFINDSLITHFGSKGNTVYNTATYTEVSSLLRRGERNVIALRVNDWGGDGGIVAPCFVANKPPPRGIRFNLANKTQAEAFMNILHNPLIDQGVDFWWVDGGSGAVDFPGLNTQLWTNKVFYDATQEHTKKRGFIFSRYGGWGSHKYPAFFTGDTYAQWDVLAYEVPFTARGGNVLMPYITHDIGGFIGAKESFDLYARWVQFGAFSPFLRLHSAHENPEEGNVRMPWTYGDKGLELAKKFFRLRYNLIPYIYTYCRMATDQALPIVRPLYLEYPSLSKAYNYPGEYLFGEQFLVAPVTDSLGVKEVYLPPGEWIDYFTGQKYAGDKTIKEKYPLDRMPLFIKAGSIIPMQPDMAYSDEKPLETLVLDVYAGDKGSFSLYEDDGNSMDYKTGKSAWTQLAFTKAGGRTEVNIGATKGAYTGQPASRSYEIRVHGVTKPGSVTVDGKKVEMGAGKEGWSWDKDKSVATVTVDARKIRESLKVVLQ